MSKALKRQANVSLGEVHDAARENKVGCDWYVLRMS